MIAWTLIKLLASHVAGFVMKYWRIILPLLVLWYCYSQYSAQVARADKAELDLSKQVQLHKQFKDDIALETMKRSAENATKLAVAKKALQESEKQHGAVIAKFNLDRERETKNLRAYYENRIDSTKFNFTERMRLEAERVSSGLPEATSDTSRFTERERECYAGYSALEGACKLTTNDYNRLRGWANAACEQVGCEKE